MLPVSPVFHWSQKWTQSRNIHSTILDVHVGWQTAQNFLYMMGSKARATVVASRDKALLSYIMPPFTMPLPSLMQHCHRLSLFLRSLVFGPFFWISMVLPDIFYEWCLIGLHKLFFICLLCNSSINKEVFPIWGTAYIIVYVTVFPIWKSS